MVAANMQMIQTFMQTMERMALSRRVLPLSLFSQPIANPYDDVRQ
jgi:hypothetical protein